MIHLRIGEENIDSHLIEALCGDVNKDKTVLADELEDVNCPKCRKKIKNSIKSW